MNEADAKAHPWPLTGWIDFRWRKATWCIVRPWYGYHNIFIPLTAVRWMTPITFWFPFLTWNIKVKINGKVYGHHGYLGFKPITMDDQSFYWRDLDIVKKWRAEGRLFVQGAARQGFGDIS